MKPVYVLILLTIVASQVMGQLSFSVSTDKSLYGPNDPILVTITARNSSNTPDTLRFSSGCQVNYHIDTLDYMHNDSVSIGCITAFTERIVPPNDSATWNGSYWLYDFTGNFVGYGRHAVVAWVYYIPVGWRSDTLWIFVTMANLLRDDPGDREKFLLDRNYPNPFNPVTTIRFTLPHTSPVRLTIYNILGEEVTTLINKTLESGTHSIQWDGSSFPGGIYFYRLHAGRYTGTGKCLLAR